MNYKIPNLIKVGSVLIIISSLILNSWNFYLHRQDASLPINLQPFLWLGNIILIAHSIEGFIAAFKASSSDKNPYIYGIYTFFVGFPGLQELFPTNKDI